ncbi:IS66 family insertion sequence element accessory protein TnpA [Petrocella sp. FN5]|uniref:IS66 family insertion sequence element accessory protein TnpA n=1 Tax=Petrocella sp. FN5 TaxID=3032002 RepID=UPI0023DA5811|nr:IS66 family insertion sequence element accessory protein TnpB [Petrocella sp. FN5]MDF1617911.1 IS66 family insertion sequence element accessory protein TnpB [Petrocella sp. FN5]
MDDTTNEVRLEYWANIVKKCNSSGKIKRQWCEANDINEKQFYYWQRRIRTLIYEGRKTATELVAPVFVEVPVAGNEKALQVSSSNDVAVAKQNPIFRLNKGSIVIEISNLSGMELAAFTRELIFDA